MTQESAIKFKDEIKAFQEGKQIQVFTRKWIDDDNPSFSIKSKYRVKPQETKRLPTIEEVEKWFLDNRVFKFYKSNNIQRIISFDPNHSEQIIMGNGNYYGIYEFCENFTHLDGSSLYITE